MIESKAADRLKTMAGSAVAVVTLVGMIVAGIIWVHTVKTDTDRALVAVGKLESRLDEQASATRELHTAVLKLTFAVDALAKVYELRRVNP